MLRLSNTLHKENSTYSEQGGISVQKQKSTSSKRKPLQVKKNNLLVIAALVWIAAGVNILHIGLEAYAEGYANLLNEALSLVVGLVFWFGTFYRLTKKHTDRITNYEDQHQYFWRFFDLKSFHHNGDYDDGWNCLTCFGSCSFNFYCSVLHGIGYRSCSCGCAVCPQ